jgi:hypothetical protein
MIFDTFLIPAMAQAAEETTIKATPSGIRWDWDGQKGQVLFRCLNTNEVYTVEGMTVRGDKGYLDLYDLKFAIRIFDISLDAGGKGVHYAEGIRWNDQSKTWVKIPMPEPYLSLEARGAFETPSSILVKYVWDTLSCTWLCDDRNVDFPVFRLSGTNGPLNCWEHRSDNLPCHCEGIDSIRAKFNGFDIHLECSLDDSSDDSDDRKSYYSDIDDYYDDCDCDLCSFYSRHR